MTEGTGLWFVPFIFAERNTRRNRLQGANKYSMGILSSERLHAPKWGLYEAIRHSVVLGMCWEFV